MKTWVSSSNNILFSLIKYEIFSQGFQNGWKKTLKQFVSLLNTPPPPLKKNYIKFKVTRWLIICVLLFDYENGHRKMCKKIWLYAFSSNKSPLSLQKFLKLVCKQSELFWTLLWVSRDCDCCPNIVTMELTLWEQKKTPWNLRFFDVFSKTNAFIDSVS